MMDNIVRVQTMNEPTGEWFRPSLTLWEGQSALIVGPTRRMLLTSSEDPGSSCWSAPAGCGLVVRNMGMRFGTWNLVENLHTRDDVRRYVERWGPMPVYRLVGAYLVRDKVEDKPWPVLT